MSERTVLVTGAAGFLGSRVVAKLLTQGYSVITTDSRGEVDLPGDLSDSTFTKNLPSVDAVIHCAAVQYVSPNLPVFFRRAFFTKNNVAATRNLAQRFSIDSGTRIVMVGTSMMYSVASESGKRIAPDPTNFGNNGLYSKSKVDAWNEIFQLKNPTALVVPCIIAGRGRGGLFTSLISTMSRFKLAVIPGRGRTIVHMVHVDDVADLLTLIVSRDASGVFNAGGLDPLTLNDWAVVIAKALQSNKVGTLHAPLWMLKLAGALSAYRVLAEEQLRMLEADHVLDIVASNEIGWKPEWSSERILEDTVTGWLAENSD